MGPVEKSRKFASERSKSVKNRGFLVQAKQVEKSKVPKIASLEDASWEKHLRKDIVFLLGLTLELQM